MRKAIPLIIAMILLLPIVNASVDVVSGDGYEITIYDASEIPEVSYQEGILSIEDINMTKAEVKLWHTNNVKGVRANPTLKVKLEGSPDFITATPYCLNKTVENQNAFEDCTVDGNLNLSCYAENSHYEVADYENCFNYVYIDNETYQFGVEHFSSYQILDDEWNNFTFFNDSITDGQFTYYNLSLPLNKWRNRTKVLDNVYSWTNVTNATIIINEEPLTDGLLIGDVYSRGTGRGFRGMTYDGTYWYTGGSAITLDSIVRIWDNDWNLVGNITVNVPGGGMACDYRDLEFNPQNPSELMVLCSETSAGFNWFRWANLTTGQQDWSRNWTLPPGYYQAAALTNNYIIAARTSGSWGDAGLFRFNKTDGSLIDNYTSPVFHNYQGGWSNGTHAYFIRGEAWGEQDSYIVCPEDNITACTNVGWLPPQCEVSELGQQEDTADLVITDDWFAISWDDRISDGCENSVDVYYNQDVPLTGFKVYGWNNTLISNQPGWCYQEFANESTDCGGVGTGAYAYTGGWTNPLLTFDGNWSTDAWSTGAGDYLYINYTKPLGALSTSIWIVEDTTAQRNFTIPSSCWNYDSDKLIFRAYSTAAVQHSWACYNGSWNILQAGSTSGIHEEAMLWDIDSTIDFKDDLLDFITNGCNPNSQLQCDPYQLRFEGYEGVANYSDIFIRMTTGFSTLEDCLLIYNGTQNCCYLNRDNYYEQLSGADYSIGDGTCAVRVAGDNITLDFNDAEISALLPGHPGLYSYRASNNLNISNVNLLGYANPMYIDSYQTQNINFNNIYSSIGQVLFIYGTNINANNLQLENCANNYCLIGDNVNSLTLENVDIINSSASLSHVSLLLQTNGIFRNFDVEGTSNLDCVELSNANTNLLLENWNCDLSGGYGIDMLSTTTGGNTFRNFNIIGADNGVRTYADGDAYENITVGAVPGVGFNFEAGADGNTLTDYVVLGSQEQGLIVRGDNTELSMLRLSEVGNSSTASGFYSSLSPLSYSGNDYDDIIMYIDSTGLILEPVTGDNAPQITVADGTNDFDLWLANVSGTYATLYVDDSIPVNCSTFLGLYGGVCDYESVQYWQANGATSNYTLNQPGAVSVVSGYSNPAWLTYIVNSTQTYPPINIFGDSNLMHNVIIYNSSNPIFRCTSLTASSANNRIWNQQYLVGGPNDLGTNNRWCSPDGSTGNFYEESIIDIPPTECGLARITSQPPYIGETGYAITWRKQDTVPGVPVAYDVIFNNTYQTTTLSTNYPLDVSALETGTTYNVTIIPWINGSRYNGTHASSSFSILPYTEQYSIIQGNLLYILVAFSILVVILAATIIAVMVYTGTADIGAIIMTVLAIAAGFGILLTMVVVVLRNVIV